MLFRKFFRSLATVKEMLEFQKITGAKVEQIHSMLNEVLKLYYAGKTAIRKTDGVKNVIHDATMRDGKVHIYVSEPPYKWFGRFTHFEPIEYFEITDEKIRQKNPIGDIFSATDDIIKRMAETTALLDNSLIKKMLERIESLEKEVKVIKN